MTVSTISPLEAERAVADGRAVLIDIRDAAEHVRESIPGACLMPLAKFAEHDFKTERARAPMVIFHCQSGMRTRANLDTLAAASFPEARVLEGGLAAWKAAGLKTNLDKTKPIEMQRQVQIAAGALVLTGLVLGATISPWFAALSAFVGAGLVFAGVSGWCGMAHLLALMPWNRQTA
jgi:rhodanese-related sulfurtransferase